jgi:hypothetical protein
MFGYVMEGDNPTPADERRVREKIVLDALVSMVAVNEKHIQGLGDVSNSGGDFFRVRIATNQVHTLKRFAECVIEQRTDLALSSPEFAAGKVNANDRGAWSRQSGEDAERSSLERAYF